MMLSDEILDDIDGGEECRGRDSRLTEWARRAKALESECASYDKLFEDSLRIIKKLEADLEMAINDDRGVL